MRLLLVEDEVRLADATARGLRQAAHAVDVAHRLAEARQKLALEPYEALLLDVNLPDGSGFALAREVRAAGHEFPILMLTSRDAVEDRVAGLDAGADDYLVKPFAVEELLARLRALARRPRAVRPSTIVVGDLAVDPATRRARRGAREIELTSTEYAMLEHLAMHAGEVRNRAQISAAVWDENYDPASNLIEVYVARLRRKLEAPGEPPLLHTLRGAGYVLEPARAAGE